MVLIRGLYMSLSDRTVNNTMCISRACSKTLKLITSLIMKMMLLMKLQSKGVESLMLMVEKLMMNYFMFIVI